MDDAQRVLHDSLEDRGIIIFPRHVSTFPKLIGSPILFMCLQHLLEKNVLAPTLRVFFFFAMAQVVVGNEDVTFFPLASTIEQYPSQGSEHAPQYLRRECPPSLKGEVCMLKNFLPPFFPRCGFMQVEITVASCLRYLALQVQNSASYKLVKLFA